MASVPEELTLSAPTSAGSPSLVAAIARSLAAGLNNDGAVGRFESALRLDASLDEHAASINGTTASAANKRRRFDVIDTVKN
jgi:hypothetical protein